MQFLNLGILAVVQFCKSVPLAFSIGALLNSTVRVFKLSIVSESLARNRLSTRSQPETNNFSYGRSVVKGSSEAP